MRSVIARAAAASVIALLAIPAQAAPKTGTRVSVTACPYAGVLAPCTMIKGRDGTVYNITGAGTKPPLDGRMVRVRGVVTDKLSMCVQGVVLDQVRLTSTRQKCAK